MSERKHTMEVNAEKSEAEMDTKAEPVANVFSGAAPGLTGPFRCVT
jgi:hypothetical protein